MHNDSVPPSDRNEQHNTPDSAEPMDGDSTRKTYPCNETLRAELRALRDAPNSIWSNAEIGRKLYYSRAVISQYLNESGCYYNARSTGRENKSLEQKVEDFLRALQRRKATGVETSSADVSKEMFVAFEIIRKTNDLGAIIADSGEGKTRGIELIMKEHALSRLVEVTEWNNTTHAMLRELWEVIPHDDWDRHTPQALWLVKKARGTDWPFIFDDAHKLSSQALSMLATFQEKTGCPVCLVGTPELVKKLEADPQRYSRVGISWHIQNTEKADLKLLKHIINSFCKTVNGDMDQMVEYCKQVAIKQGHYRAVHKQLKVAAEIRQGAPDMSWPEAFKEAHTHLLRPYQLKD
jgi:DNA transposition AAA+ family ATPase